jgi:hypothetical protein
VADGGELPPANVARQRWGGLSPRSSPGPHGEPPRLEWLAIAAPVFGAAVGAAGRRGSHLTVPAVLFAVAAVICVAVFEFRSVYSESATFAVVGYTVVGEPDFKAPRDWATQVSVFPGRPHPTGCGRSLVGVRLPSPPSAGGATPRSRDRTIRMILAHPPRAKVTEVEHGRVVRTVAAGDAGYAVIDAMTSSPEPVSGRYVYVSIERLAHPRTVGSCYVPLPALTRASVFIRYALEDPRLTAANVYVPARGVVDLDDRDQLLVRDATYPPPHSADAGGARWLCDSASAPREPGVTEDCKGVGVIEAQWRRPFEQIAMLLVGALVALAAEDVILLLRGRAS